MDGIDVFYCWINIKMYVAVQMSVLMCVCEDCSITPWPQGVSVGKALVHRSRASGPISSS